MGLFTAIPFLKSFFIVLTMIWAWGWTTIPIINYHIPDDWWIKLFVIGVLLLSIQPIKFITNLIPILGPMFALLI